MHPIHASPLNSSRVVNLSLKSASDPKKCDPLCLCFPTPCEKSVVARGPDVKHHIWKRCHRHEKQWFTAESSDIRLIFVFLIQSVVCRTSTYRLHPTPPCFSVFHHCVFHTPLSPSTLCTWCCTTDHIVMAPLLPQCVTTAAQETCIPIGRWLASLLRTQCECLQQSWAVLSVRIDIYYKNCNYLSRF